MTLSHCLSQLRLFWTQTYTALIQRTYNVNLKIQSLSVMSRKLTVVFRLVGMEMVRPCCLKRIMNFFLLRSARGPGAFFSNASPSSLFSPMSQLLEVELRELRMNRPTRSHISAPGRRNCPWLRQRRSHYSSFPRGSLCRRVVIFCSAWWIRYLEALCCGWFWRSW